MLCRATNSCANRLDENEPERTTNDYGGVAMSTKVSLNHCVDEKSGMKAHLYEECLAPDDFPVFLEITSASEVSVDVTPRGTQVTVAIPRGLAVKLGLIISLESGQ